MAFSTLFAMSLLPSTTIPKTSSSRSASRRSSVVAATGSASPSCLTESVSASASVSVSDISSWMAIAFPAVAYSTRLYFKSTTFNVEVKAKEDEPVDKLINRFRKEVMKAGVLQECKRRRFFENKHDKKKRKARDAARRNRMRKPQSRARAQVKHEAPIKKKDDEEDDNWELPDVDPPYC